MDDREKMEYSLATRVKEDLYGEMSLERQWQDHSGLVI
jgi:hypothetical protein